jgi:hypothetical protein
VSFSACCSAEKLIHRIPFRHAEKEPAESSAYNAGNKMTREPGNGSYIGPFNCVRLVASKEALEGPMVRELELLAVTVVFMFLGACVMGVVH